MNKQTILIFLCVALSLTACASMNVRPTATVIVGTGL